MQSTFICVPEHQQGDILLIYPDFAKNSLGVASYPENHLGLNRLASFLHEKDKKVSVLNTTGMREGNEGPKQLAEFLKENLNTYDVIGFHINSWNISHVIQTLQTISKKLKNKLILFGGPLPTAMPRKVLELMQQTGLQNLGLIQGYGEFKLEEILNNQTNLSEIEGVWSLQNDKLTEGTLQRFTSEQMESLPLLNPTYNTFYQNYYKPFQDSQSNNQSSEFSLDMIYSAQGLDTNHGCPFNCSYCSVHIFGHQMSEYTPKRVCDELEHTAKETGIFMYTFTNSNLLFLRREWGIDFCNEIIKRNLHEYITWSAYHHPNTINLLSTEDLKLLKKAGCDQIVIGIQSVEPKILQLFNRHPKTYEIFKEIQQKTSKADLELVIDYIRGIPGEDVEIAGEFYDYCIENQIEMREFLLKIYPNTEITQKNIDFTGYELIPITGNLAPELDSYAVIPQSKDPRNAVLTQKINQSNQQIQKTRKIRLGQQYLTNQTHAEQLIKSDIPENPHIPPKVKTAMITMLQTMISPPPQTASYANQTPEQMLKTLVMADENAPPMVKKMQQKLLLELGDQKFQELKQKYSSN